MITIYNTNYDKNYTNRGTTMVELRGLSTDGEKPTDIEGTPIGNGSTFIEIDTGKIYMYDQENQQWQEV